MSLWTDLNGTWRRILGGGSWPLVAHFEADLGWILVARRRFPVEFLGLGANGKWGLRAAGGCSGELGGEPTEAQGGPGSPGGAQGAQGEPREPKVVQGASGFRA